MVSSLLVYYLPLWFQGELCEQDRHVTLSNLDIQLSKV